MKEKDKKALVLLTSAALATAAASLARKWSRWYGRTCLSAFFRVGNGETPLPPTALEYCKQHGFIIVRGLLSGQDCAEAQNACEQLVDEEAEKLVAAGKLSQVTCCTLCATTSDLAV